MRRIVAGWMVACLSFPAFAADPLEAFPEPSEGQKRLVLKLPEQPDESARKVELLVGKTIAVDPVNRHFLAGEIKTETLSGWGYTRYVVDQLGPAGGTLIAPPPGAKKVNRFVTLRGEPYLIRYNSRMPVVIYVPDDAEVRYRIWRADPATKAIPKG